MAAEFIPQMEPFFDEKEADALRDYMLSGGWVTEFRQTQAFEAALAEFTGAAHCVLTNSGTVALTLALLAVGVGPGDEVIVPDLTMIGTANAARLIGAAPVFVDVEPQTLNLDAGLAEAAITERTRAVIHVSLHGRAGDVAGLRAMCDERGLILIEDAAQSLGSYAGAKHLGTVGHLGCFSFSVPKVITTGQGGAVVTDDEALFERLRLAKDFGRRSGGNDIHDFMGFNFKFTDLQAVVGLEQMKKLSGRIARKKEMYRRYRDGLGGLGAVQWIETDLERVSPWFMDIYVAERDALMAHLEESGIGSRPIYPPIHAQKAYGLAHLSFPVAEDFAARGLWLPSSVQLTDSQIERVTDAIRAFFGA